MVRGAGLEAGCAFVNAIPVFIASSEYWGKRFADAGLPILGDDIKSQVGATIVHRVLTSLFVDRGVKIDRTYQLNFGGNTDFLNMLERERLESKKISKTNAVTSMVPYDMGKDNVHVGPSDHVPWLTDRKWCYIRMEGTTFGNVPLNLELKLEVWDSPNSAGVMIDAVRCAKIALDRELAGPIVGPSSYFFKTPPKQFRDDICRDKVEDFISGKSRRVKQESEIEKLGDVCTSRRLTFFSGRIQHMKTNYGSKFASLPDLGAWFALLLASCQPAPATIDPNIIMTAAFETAVAQISIPTETPVHPLKHPSPLPPFRARHLHYL